MKLYNKAPSVKWPIFMKHFLTKCTLSNKDLKREREPDQIDYNLIQLVLFLLKLSILTNYDDNKIIERY